MSVTEERCICALASGTGEGVCPKHSPFAFRDIGESKRPDPRDAEIERMREDVSNRGCICLTPAK